MLPFLVSVSVFVNQLWLVAVLPRPVEQFGLEVVF